MKICGYGGYGNIEMRKCGNIWGYENEECRVDEARVRQTPHKPWGSVQISPLP